MRKVKLIVHETYQGKRKSEDVFAAVFLSKGTRGRFCVLKEPSTCDTTTWVM